MPRVRRVRTRILALEPEHRFGRDSALRHCSVRKAEPEELPLPRSCYSTLLPVHLQLEFAFEESYESLHQALSHSLTADVDVAVVRILNKTMAMLTITDGESFFYLSAACNVIEAGDPIDSRGVLASSVLRFHIPEDIGQISAEDYVELRKQYEMLREDFPMYLRDLGEANPHRRCQEYPRPCRQNLRSGDEQMPRAVGRMKFEMRVTKCSISASRLPAHRQIRVLILPN